MASITSISSLAPTLSSVNVSFSRKKNMRWFSGLIEIDGNLLLVMLLDETSRF